MAANSVDIGRPPPPTQSEIGCIGNVPLVARRERFGSSIGVRRGIELCRIMHCFGYKQVEWG